MPLRLLCGYDPTAAGMEDSILSVTNEKMMVLIGSPCRTPLFTKIFPDLAPFTSKMVVEIWYQASMYLTRTSGTPASVKADVIA